jgi:hypothetical protein
MARYHDPLGGRNTDITSTDWRIGLQAAGVRRHAIDGLAAAADIRVASDLFDIRDWRRVPGVGARTCDLIVEFLAAQ